MKGKHKKREKYSMNTYLRIGLIALIILFIAGFSAFLYKFLHTHKATQKKVPVYSYSHKADTNYTVFLVPNIVYTEKSLEEKNTYITDFVDYINTSFKYEFNGERQADIKGVYDITASIRGEVKDEKASKMVWKRDLILQQKKEFSINDKKIAIQQEVPIKFKEYASFAQQVIKESNINFDVKLIVSCNISLEAKTDKGVIKEQISPTMEIPLSEKIFEVKGNLSQQKAGAIEEAKSIQVPINHKIVVLLYAAISFCGAVLLFLLFFTSGIIVINPLEKKLKQISKVHGCRMVGLDNSVNLPAENVINVLTIEDLVRISDDICKPILYKKNGSLKEIYKFYVMDNETVYLFELV